MNRLKIIISCFFTINVIYLLYYILFYEYFEASVVLVPQKPFDVIVLCLYSILLFTFYKMNQFREKWVLILMYSYNIAISVVLFYYLLNHQIFFPFIYYAG